MAPPLAFSWMTVSVVGIFCKCQSLLPHKKKRSETKAFREAEQTVRVTRSHTNTHKGNHISTFLQEAVSEISKNSSGSDLVDS